MFIRAEIHKMLARIANREDPYQTASSECLPINISFSPFGKQIFTSQYLQSAVVQLVKCETGDRRVDSLRP